MTSLTMGANAPLHGEKFEVSVNWKLKSSAIDEIDVSVFILTSSGKVDQDEDMIFYGQRSDKSGAVRLTDTNRAGSEGARETVFEFDLGRLQPSAERLAITGTINDADKKRVSFSDVASLVIRVSQIGSDVVRFDVPVTGMSEAALVLGELYKRNGVWKFRAVGQGYNGGLKPLAESMGVKIDDEPSPAKITPPSVPPVPLKQTPAPVSLSKVTLTKASPKVSLAKKGTSYGEIRINLNWNKRTETNAGLFGGLLRGGNKGVDLDLGCLFELKNGSKGAVQALGKSFGSLDREPFIKLMADDRTGASVDGEWMRVNGLKWNDIKRVMIYTMIYDGVANWTQTDGVVTVYVPDNPTIEIRLDEGSNDKRTCAIVLLENVGGEIVVKREVQYFRDTQDVDKKYRWGLRWQSGSK